MTSAQTRIWPSAVRSLRNVLDGSSFPLEVPKRDLSIQLRNELVQQLDDYVLPRLLNLQAPVLVCVGGSTGAGKSTLVNSLVGANICEAGVLRPTTRSICVIHNPNDAEWWQSSHILPGIERVGYPSNDPRQMQLVASMNCPEGIAIVDTPDLDSVDIENAEIATQLLAAADVWLFVTTASRYADAIPWDYLIEARRREVSLAVVLNRVPPSGLAEVADHLHRMMIDQELSQVPQFTIEQSDLASDGLIPQVHLRPIDDWLRSRQLRSQTAIATTLLGTLDSVLDRSEYLAALADGQNAAVSELEAALEENRRNQLFSFAKQLADGSIVRGECLDCWQDFAETTSFYTAVSPSGWSWNLGLPSGEIRYLIESALMALKIVLVEYSQQSRAEIVRVWRARPYGNQICMEADTDLEFARDEDTTQIGQIVTDWWEGLVETVRQAADGRLRGHRWRPIGVKGVAAACLIAVLSARGPGMMAFRLVEAALGDQAQRVIDFAGEQLGAAVQQILALDEQQFREALKKPGIDLGLGQRIRDAVAAVDQ